MICVKLADRELVVLLDVLDVPVQENAHSKVLPSSWIRVTSPRMQVTKIAMVIACTRLDLSNASSIGCMTFMHMCVQ